MTISCLERILSYQTCKHSIFWTFIPLGSPVLKTEKVPTFVKNDGFGMKFSIEVSLKIFLTMWTIYFSPTHVSLTVPIMSKMSFGKKKNKDTSNKNDIELFSTSDSTDILQTLWRSKRIRKKKKFPDFTSDFSCSAASL